jgi:hypothetical protein
MPGYHTGGKKKSYSTKQAAAMAYKKSKKKG